MKKTITILTSSRADYGIYSPLLNALESHDRFNVDLVVFGTHTSDAYGHTIDRIKEDGHKIRFEVPFEMKGDTPADVVEEMGRVTGTIGRHWSEQDRPDMVVALGDRFEMLAAAESVVPFGIPIAHIHGGETTLGAIDNKFRHAITAMADLHFASTERHKTRVVDIVGSDDHVFNVGALSLDNLDQVELLSDEQFLEKFDIDLSKPSILVTFHPETVAYEKNEAHVDELIAALSDIDRQIIITMPNSDTSNAIVRKKQEAFAASKENVIAVESLGLQGYFTAMDRVECLIGNTSSGIIEAASFNKWVINVGDRQKGRDAGENVVHVPAKKGKIVRAFHEVIGQRAEGREDREEFENIYWNGGAVKRIIEVLGS